MVGRDAELRRLVRLAVGSAPQVALVAGEAGIGKSRLVRELLDGLPADTRVLVAQADPGALGRPFGLLLDAVDGLAPAGSVDDPAPAGSVDPDALRILGDPGHSIVERLRAAAGIVQVLTAQPAVVVFEDLHWADPESTALFERIPDLTGRRLLVGTYRPDEVTRRSPVAELLTRLERRYPVTHLRLERLGLTETSVLLEAVSGRPPSYRAAASLHNRTGGNPYFLEELLRAGGDGGLDLERLCEQPLPWNLAEALRRQLDDVDPRQQRVVEAAAVLGHKIPFDVLAAVTQLPEYDLIVVLRDLVRRGLMIEIGEDEFSFRHALAREAVAGQLLGRERRRLHELALDTLLAAGDADPALVARHARGAGRYDDLIRAAREGCTRYLAAGSAHQALLLAEMGLEEAPDDLELRAGAARAAWLANLLDDADQHARRWAADATTAEDRSAALRLLVRRAWEDGRREDTRALMDEIRDIIEELPTGAEQAHAMGTVAQSYMLTDQLADAIAWADLTIALAEKLGLPGVRMAAAVEKGSALLRMPDGVDEGRRLLLASAEQAEQVGEWLTAARALHNLIGIVPASTLAEGHELLERMRADAERAGFEALAVAAYFEARARFALEDGDLRAAMAVLEEGHRSEGVYQRRSRGDNNFHAVFMAGLALEAGELDRAESIIAGLTGPGSGPSLQVLGLVFHLACRRGDATAAEAALDDLYAGVDRAGTLYGEQVHDLVAAGRAAGLPAGRLRPLAERASWSEAAEGQRAQVCAQLDEADGRHAEALAGYETAAASRELRPANRASAHLGAARCLIDLGQLDRAREHVSAAETLLVEWAGWRVAELDALRGRVGLPAPATAGDRDGVLTPREREVAALIAEGLTNAELARRLYISKKTAAVHVSNILGKLGLSSRTQVAGWLHRPG
jgi:DNA-binding CsgD family transcriptional regulator